MPLRTPWRFSRPGWSRGSHRRPRSLLRRGGQYTSRASCNRHSADATMPSSTHGSKCLVPRTPNQLRATARGRVQLSTVGPRAPTRGRERPATALPDRGAVAARSWSCGGSAVEVWRLDRRAPLRLERRASTSTPSTGAHRRLAAPALDGRLAARGAAARGGRGADGAAVGRPLPTEARLRSLVQPPVNVGAGVLMELQRALLAADEPSTRSRSAAVNTYSILQGNFFLTPRRTHRACTMGRTTHGFICTHSILRGG